MTVEYRNKSVIPAVAIEMEDWVDENVPSGCYYWRSTIMLHGEDTHKVVIFFDNPEDMTLFKLRFA